MFKKMIRVPQKVSKPLSIILLFIIIVFGSYSIATSSFTEWLAAPFITETKSEDHADINENLPDSSAGIPKSGENKNGNYVESATPKAGEEPKQGNSGPNGYMQKKSPEGSPMDIVSTIATFLSIIGVFTAASYYLDKFFSKGKTDLLYL